MLGAGCPRWPSSQKSPIITLNGGCNPPAQAKQYGRVFPASTCTSASQSLVSSRRPSRICSLPVPSKFVLMTQFQTRSSRTKSENLNYMVKRHAPERTDNHDTRATPGSERGTQQKLSCAARQAARPVLHIFEQMYMWEAHT